MGPRRGARPPSLDLRANLHGCQLSEGDGNVPETVRQRDNARNRGGFGQNRCSAGLVRPLRPPRSVVTGKPAAFLTAAGVVVVWAATRPLFNYSDTWQLVINTGTTIVTFLMVFMIQNTQNRDTLAIQLKLAEIILAMKETENRFATIEDLSDDELQQMQDEFRSRAEQVADSLNRRRSAQEKGKGT
jgi:low affinity Fe/Cu permease